MSLGVILQEKFSPDTWQAFFSQQDGHTINANKNWINAYYDTYLQPPIVPFVMQVQREEESIGFLPMQLEVKQVNRWLKTKDLYPLGWGPSDFFPIPCQSGMEDEMAVAITTFLKSNSKLWDTMTIQNVPVPSAVASGLKKSLVDEGFSCHEQGGFGFYTVDTSGDWSTYFERFIKPQNKDLLKDLRRLDREGVRLEVLSYRHNVYNKLVPLLDLYAQRRSSLGQSNSYETKERRAFVEQVTTAFEKGNHVELSVLQDEAGEPWAFQLDFLWEGTRYHWNHAYNEDFKKHSPGKILLLRLLESSFEDPAIREVNHMRGSADYKSKLADTFNPYINYQVVNTKSKRLKWLNTYHQLSYLKKWIS